MLGASLFVVHWLRFGFHSSHYRCQESRRQITWTAVFTIRSNASGSMTFAGGVIDDDFSLYPASCGAGAAGVGFEMGEPGVHEVPMPPGLDPSP